MRWTRVAIVDAKERVAIAGDFLKQEQLKQGYQPVVTPHIARVDLFKTSGHWQKYKRYVPSNGRG